MPRADVPYPSREICSLKCQIDALQRQINELMKSVNGVQGDGQGNVSLVSGDPAVVINNDAAQHEVKISLDQSQLPAAAVQSVNGQTGVVQLEADDIASDGNSDVQTDIDTLKNLGVTLQRAINGEITARGNADAALQGNINTLQASIPGEAANAVANDPTVIQLAVDVPNKLDKISSGSTLKAYTHIGANQGEKSVVDGVDADSIGIRDADGRMHAADPASGATDKTLVTANWVSQTGAGRPNNLIHDSGNEDINGRKYFNDAIDVNSVKFVGGFPSYGDGTQWTLVYRAKDATTQNTQFRKFGFIARRYRARASTANSDWGLGECFFQGGTEAYWVFFTKGADLDPSKYKALIVDNKAEFYLKTSSANNRMYLNGLYAEVNGSNSPWIEFVNEVITDATKNAQIEAAPNAVVLT